MKPLFTGSEWTFDIIQKTWEEIDKIGREELKLDYYDPQIEVISSEQMLDAYSSHAMPQMYSHWSFGKSFIQNENGYKTGRQGLAYEVVINTNPSIAYLMENNTATLQTLVMAHAVCGHSTFFKTNYLFKDWTDADYILDYLNYAKNYIARCEEKYGALEVELLLDACHSLQYHGIDKYRRPHISDEMRASRIKEAERHLEADFNDIWRTVPERRENIVHQLIGDMNAMLRDEMEIEKVSEENLLYFIEKRSPILEDWEREIVRIVRKISQYFYPQMQTSLLNEGFACLIHHEIMTRLNEKGLITDGSYLEFLQNHSGVVFQPEWDSQYYSGINVYALGYAMLTDIKRLCQNPDEEDKKWFPDICNTNWVETIKDIVENYRDESFVLQFLSPKVIRQFKLFSIISDEKESRHYTVSAVQDDEDVKEIRRLLSEHYDISKRIPQIEVVGVDSMGDRTIYLNHYSERGQLLNFDDAKATSNYLYSLWGFPVDLTYLDTDGNEINKV